MDRSAPARHARRVSRFRLAALVGAIASLALGGLAIAGAGKRGAIVRVDVRRPLEVLVPAGEFTMGVVADPVEELTFDDFDACVVTPVPSVCRACQTFFSDKVAKIGIACESYMGMLEAMAPRQVYLDAFWIDRAEVTGAAYRRCVAAGGCTADALVAGDPRYVDNGLPMVNVTWADAGDYCRWRGARLPTEAEWEKLSLIHI